MRPEFSLDRDWFLDLYWSLDMNASELESAASRRSEQKAARA